MLYDSMMLRSCLCNLSGKIWDELHVDFPEWIMQSTECIVELRLIADSIDDYHQSASKANWMGTFTGAVGGIVSIAGIIAVPFSMGTSLVLTGVGMTAGAVSGVTNAVANIKDHSNQDNKQKRVNEIVKQYLKLTQKLTDKVTQLTKAIKGMIKIKSGNLPNASFVATYQGLVNSVCFLTTVKCAVTQSAVKTLKSVSGVLSGLTIVWDIYSLNKIENEMKEKETEISKMIRMIAANMEEGRNHFKKELSEMLDCKALKEEVVKINQKFYD